MCILDALVQDNIALVGNAEEVTMSTHQLDGGSQTKVDTSVEIGTTPNLATVTIK